MPDLRATTYHNLAILLSAGLPILKSLRICSKGSMNRLSRAFQEIALDVQQGHSLSDSMAKHPKAFAKLDVMLIKAGETSGNLSEIVKMLSEWYEFRNQLKNTFRAGMALPVVVLLAAAFIIPFPAFITTGMTMAGYLLRVATPLACLFIPIAVILAIVYFTPDAGPLRFIVDWIGTKIPVLGRAVRRLALSRYFSIFNMLFRSGVPVVESAKMAAETTGNAVVGQWFRGGAEVALEGHPISAGFSRDVPKEFLDAWIVGEETGDLDKVAQRLANITAQQAQDAFKQVSIWVPIIIYSIIAIWIIKHIFILAETAYHVNISDLFR